MAADHTTSLSPSRRRLITLMSSIGFGTIHDLHVEIGEPVLDPSPAVTREIKFGCDAAGPTPDRPAAFALKRQVIELFDQLEQIDFGVIDHLEIRHGLPFRMIIGARDV